MLSIGGDHYARLLIKLQNSPMNLTGIGRILDISRDGVRNLESHALNNGLRQLRETVEAYAAC